MATQRGRFATQVTQSGADVFTQVVVNTGLLGQTKAAYRILDINWEWTTVIPHTATCSRAIQLTRRSKAVESLINDKDMLFKTKEGERITTSGAFIQNLTGIYNPEGDILLVEDPVYVAIASSLTAVANSAVLVVNYEIITISEVDRLTLLTQSLS
jgi:hypothetical protein